MLAYRIGFCVRAPDPFASRGYRHWSRRRVGTHNLAPSLTGRVTQGVGPWSCERGGGFPQAMCSREGRGMLASMPSNTAQPGAQPERPTALPLGSRRAARVGAGLALRWAARTGGVT